MNVVSKPCVPNVDFAHLGVTWEVERCGLLLFFLVDNAITESVLEVLFEFYRIFASNCWFDGSQWVSFNAESEQAVNQAKLWVDVTQIIVGDRQSFKLVQRQD